LNGPVFHKIDENESLQNKNNLRFQRNVWVGAKIKKKMLKKDENDLLRLKILESGAVLAI
jgi:hypothetical protein